MEQNTAFELSAVDIRLPQVGDIVERYRQKYTTDGAEGMPPHVTLLYPFLTASDYTHTTQTLLAEIMATCPPFDLHLGGLHRFPGVLYIEVTPKEPILYMIQRLVHEFPTCVPYGGTIPVHDLTPHVTLAINPSAETLDEIAHAFTRETAQMTCESMVIEAVSVSVKTSGRWRQLSVFQLGTRCP
jgi:2'-5' RNA ligase